MVADVHELFEVAGKEGSGKNRVSVPHVSLVQIPKESGGSIL